MVCLPFPTFLNSATSSPDALSLSAVGRARIHPQADDGSYQEIVLKCLQQSQVPEDTKENKKLRKKYMKQGVQLASDFLSLQLKLDVSVIDVEIVLAAKNMVDSDGCLACCFLDAGCQYIVVQVEGGEEGLNQALETIEINRLPRERIVLDYQLSPNQKFVEEVTDVSSQVGTICVKMSEGCCGELLQKMSTWEQKTKLLVEVPNDTVQSKNLDEFVASVSKSMGEDKGSIALVDPNAEQLGLAYAACIKTDRKDGLFSTVVCTRSNEALGLVYSSKVCSVFIIHFCFGISASFLNDHFFAYAMNVYISLFYLAHTFISGIHRCCSRMWEGCILFSLSKWLMAQRRYFWPLSNPPSAGCGL